MPDDKTLIFISHASQDRDAAEALRDWLLELFRRRAEVFVSSYWESSTWVRPIWHQ
ncbi:MAG: hypothetical protein HUU20_07485 [Pirellulales bacterium]|nr:hypothetical protein [Pirellulales bacterium]